MSKAATYGEFVVSTWECPLHLPSAGQLHGCHAGLERGKGGFHDMICATGLSHMGAGQTPPLSIFIRDTQKPKKRSDFQIGREEPKFSQQVLPSTCGL